MIKANGLAKFYKRKGGKKNEKVVAVEDVSFTAEDGAITGLLGPNGAGKSTTLRMLATLVVPDSGSAEVDGFSITNDAISVRRSIGYLPHNAGIYPRLTAEENIVYFAEVVGLDKKQAQQRAGELCEQLEMHDFFLRRTEGFSQGQKTKVALARALVHKPRTLILDEPTNGLDVMAMRGLRKIIRRLSEEGHCILFSSHVMQEVAALCDHIAIISDGKIAISDSLAGILSSTGQKDLEDAFVIAIGEQLELE